MDMIKEDLKEYLNRLYHNYNSKSFLCADPLGFVWRFRRKEDKEIVALVASSLAYGHVKQINSNVQKILNKIGPNPFDHVKHFRPENWKVHFDGIQHRFSTGLDLANLFFFMKQMIDQYGSIESFFLAGYSSANPIAEAICSFSIRALALKRVEDFSLIKGGSSRDQRCDGVKFFFPSPTGGSACKRMNLFLRWMVRKDNLDLGIWKNIDKSLLVIPLDTHIASISQRLGWTTRKNPSWNMALEVTESLKEMDPEDPVKYDFALCHNQMLGGASHSCC